MDFIFPIIFAVLVVGLAFLLLTGAAGTKKQKQKTGRAKDRQTIIRDANKKLAQNPHNPQGLRTLADLYYSEHVWEKAFSLYNLMLDISTAHPEIDELTTGLRQGICAIKMNSHVDAFKGLMVARKLDPNNNEVNFYLGVALFLNKDYEKAVPLFKRTIIAMPDNQEAYRYLGLSLSKNKKYRESLPYLKRSLETTPDDKEILFCIAVGLAETNSIERSLKIFSHLRPDPEYGPRASLQAGILHASTNQLEKAIEDFSIGLKHENVPIDIAIETRYRKGQALLKLQNISEALATFKEIQSMQSNYKDVPAMIAQYQELNQNKNLQIYLIATNSDFVILCKQIISVCFPHATVRITDITSETDHTEIIAEIDTQKWEDLVVFRFYRTAGVTGELCVRDFHAKIRDTKAGRGMCFTAGTFSEEGRKYIDGRPIDLIEKTELTKLLSNISKSPDAAEIAAASVAQSAGAAQGSAGAQPANAPAAQGLSDVKVTNTPPASLTRPASVQKPASPQPPAGTR